MLSGHIMIHLDTLRKLAFIIKMKALKPGKDTKQGTEVQNLPRYILSLHCQDIYGSFFFLDFCSVGPRNVVCTHAAEPGHI